MADNNKTIIPGKTVYLKEGEKFDSVTLPNGTQGSSTPAQANSSAVRAASQQPGRSVRVNPSGSVIRASVQPTAPQQKQQQDPKMQVQQAEPQRQFLRASRMPVTVEKEQVQPDAPAPQPEQRSFVRASKMPVTVEKESVVPEEPLQPEIAVVDQPQEQQPEREEVVAEQPETVAEASSQAQQQEEETAEKADREEIAMDIIENKKPAAAQEQPSEKKRPKFVDLSKISVLNKTEIDKERDLRQALFNNKAAFQIIAAQSGYLAKVSPLVNKDVNNLLYGNLGRYEYKKAVYKTIFDKVLETSVGKMDFDGWLKNTTVEDMETFYYGVYASTFPNKGTFRFTCPSCGKEHDYNVNHNNLIKTTDRDSMKRLIDEVSRNANTPEKMREYSLIGKNQAVQLSESGIVAELRTPSLNDSLEILRTVPEKTIDKDAATITNVLYINRVLIPSKEGGSYSEESNKTGVLRIIDSLSIEDAAELQTAVYDRVDENRITYSIKNIKCVDCGKEEKDIPLSIEDILFTLIFEKAQQ